MEERPGGSRVADQAAVSLENIWEDARADVRLCSGTVSHPDLCSTMVMCPFPRQIKGELSRFIPIFL